MASLLRSGSSSDSSASSNSLVSGVRKISNELGDATGTCELGIGRECADFTPDRRKNPKRRPALLSAARSTWHGIEGP